MDLSLLLAACFISLVGLPHGALDPVVAYRSGLISSFKSASLFFSGYLIIVGSVVAIWLLMPSLSLTLFLLLSALHFGRDWYHKLKFGGIAYGFLVLGLPAFVKSQEVLNIFSFLTIGESAEFPLLVLQFFGVIGAFLISLEANQLSWLRWLELLLLTVAATLTNPLWYFVIYFCAFHSPRHLVSELLRMTQQQRIIAYSCILGITILTLAIAAVSGAHVEVYYDDINILIYQIVFIGLAALTVPHMCLLEWVAKYGS